MPDNPDYSKYLPNSNRFSLQDMGELAARLGSVSVFDRRGEVLWYDNFSYGMGGFATGAFGTGSSVALSSIYTHRFPFSLLLRSGSTSALTALIEKFIGTFGSPRFGIELGFAYGSNADYIQVLLGANQFGSAYKGILRIFADTGIIKVLDENAVYRTVGTCFTFITDPPSFLNIKLVIDFELNKYIRLMVNSQSFDLTPYDIRNDGDASVGQVHIAVYNVGDNGQNSNMYVSYIIVTANEP